MGVVSEDIGLTVSASESGASGAPELAVGGGWGIGVVGSGDTDPWANQIESWGASQEGLLLSFDRAVQIDRITFQMTDMDDRVGLEASGGDQVFKVGRDGLLTLGGDLWTGTEFALSPETWTFCTWFSGQNLCEERGSGFRVASIEVSELPANVPLPASIVLLAGGLVGLGVLARRRRPA